MFRILDTDVLSILEEQSEPAYGRLQARLRHCSPDEVCTTIVSFQERVQGWMAVLHKSRSAERLVEAYAGLEGILRNFTQLKVLSFDRAAWTRFDHLQQQRLRLGTMDLRIASIVLVNNAMLLSRNLRDFRKVPELVVEDWTR